MTANWIVGLFGVVNMKRIISAKLQPSQYMIQLGKYIYNNVEYCYQYKSSVNTFDCYLRVHYTIDEDLIEEGESSEGYIDLNLNLVTYQNKIRINLYELDNSYQKVIGTKILEVKDNFNVKSECDKLLKFVFKKIGKEYEGLYAFD